MDLKNFRRAASGFGKLESISMKEGGRQVADSLDTDAYFSTAAHACAILYSLSEEQRRELGQKVIPTIPGVLDTSLETAMRAVNDYLIHQKIQFYTGEYEKLYRVCLAARIFLEHCDGNYTPRR